MKHRLSTSTLASLLALMFIFGLIVLALEFYPRFYMAQTRRSLVDGVRIGMSRSEVIRRLGQPENIARSSQEFSRPGGYFPVPTRPVEKEVLEYYNFIWKLYVYIDRQDRVSALIVAKT